MKPEIETRANALLHAWLKGAVQAGHLAHPVAIKDVYGVAVAIAEREHLDGKKIALPLDTQSSQE